MKIIRHTDGEKYVNISDLTQVIAASVIATQMGELLGHNSSFLDGTKAALAEVMVPLDNALTNFEAQEILNNNGL